MFYHCAPRVLLISVATGAYYNVCNVRSSTLVSDRTVTGSLQSFKIYKYFHAPRIGTWHVSTQPRHLSSGPPSWPPSPSSSLWYEKVTSDARPSSPWVLRSALPLPLELHMADLILQARRRWVATLTSGRRFVGSIRSRISFGSESPWSSVRIPNISPS
jgi:hypothetical protein